MMVYKLTKEERQTVRDIFGLTCIERIDLEETVDCVVNTEASEVTITIKGLRHPGDKY